MDTLTPEQIEALAESAAEKALSKFEATAELAAERALTKFVLPLGIDASTPEGLLRAQKYMNHVRQQYDACQTVREYGRHGLKTAIGVLVTAFIAYILLLFGWKSP